MVDRQIPINAPFWSNAERESKVAVANQRRDVMKDLTGTTIRRPGLDPFNSGLPAPSNGLYYWPKADKVFLESSGDLYSLTEAGALTLESSDFFSSSMFIDWAESGDLTLVTAGATRKLFAASGGPLSVFDGTTGSRLTGSNDPVKSTHVVNFDTYTIANDLSAEKYDESAFHSKVAEPENFEGAFFSAENRPDPINAIHNSWPDELMLIGTESLQHFYNNKVDPFAAIPGGAMPVGTHSPWSIKFDDAYFLLDAKRQLIRIDGRQQTVLSLPISDLLNTVIPLETLNEAYGDLLTVNGRTLYLLTISERTFVYDFALKEWVGEWGFWSKPSAQYRAFPARNFLNIKEWGITLCSDKTSGIIYKVDEDVYQDNGNEIRSSIITGSIDHGTTREKRSNELRLTLKRGQMPRTSPSDVEPVLIVRWRDDGSKEWQNDRQIGLGFEGDFEFTRSIFMLGTYRSREWEIYCTENIPFSIVKATEDIEVLR